MAVRGVSPKASCAGILAMVARGTEGTGYRLQVTVGFVWRGDRCPRSGAIYRAHVGARGVGQGFARLRRAVGQQRARWSHAGFDAVRLPDAAQPDLGAMIRAATERLTLD